MHFHMQILSADSNNLLKYSMFLLMDGWMDGYNYVFVYNTKIMRDIVILHYTIFFNKE